MSNSYPKIAVFVSGNGSNLQSIIDHIKAGKLHARVALVVSNQKNAYALVRAEQAGIPISVVPHQLYKDRSKYDQALLAELAKHDVEYVILAGFMRILGKDFLSKYPDKVLNIHPSLLPKYPGIGAIQQALSNLDSETGVTVHYVNEGVDTGPIILQDRVPILKGDTLVDLEARVQKVEHQIYPKAIQKVLWDK